ncbi:arylesterase [Halioglobus sp. HI00S01]|uniref:arylesterase n=1 Tax=Halioglobus sp. HI00S01 TaxID=1822214 RepID=UPI0007C2535D|nr:arylesterase [Halioglobus sp. HI00S01]KZX56597.1 arylesterase [Halioglobus sp. HI00S01]
MQRFLYRLLRVFTVVGLLLASATTPAQSSGTTLLVLGDSISAAYGMSLQEGWVALLARHIAEERPGTEVVNASISGETTGGALRRLPVLLEQHKPDLVVIELGGNDGLRGFPLNDFRDNLTQLATLSQDAGAKVLFLPMRIPPNYGSRYTQGFYDSYARVAEASGSAIGAFILEAVAIDPQLMQEDGIHPKAEAQQTMLDTVYPDIRGALP